MPDPGQEEPLERMEKIVNALLVLKDSEPFREPVDWRGLELHDYLDHVDKPMDLGTIKKRLERGQYKTAHECAEDCRLVWANCQAYNADGSDFWLLAKSFARRFEDRYRKVRQEFDVGQPATKPPKRKSSSTAKSRRSAASDEDSEESEEESEMEEESSEEEETSDEDDSDEDDEEVERSSKRAKRRGSASSGRASTNEGPSNLDARVRFGSNLFLLSGKELGQVMSTIELECPEALEKLGTSEFGDSKLEINVDAIPHDVFTQLSTYANTRTHSKGHSDPSRALGGAAPSTNVVAAPPMPARRGPGRPKKS